MSLDSYTLDASEQRLNEVRGRNLRLISLRWAYVALIAFVGIGILALAGTAGQKKVLPATILAVLFALGLNFVLWLYSRRHVHKTSYYRTIAFAQVAIDISLASFVVYSQGGPLSRATALYAIPIIATGILYARSFVYITAAFCGIAYTLVSVCYFVLHRDMISTSQLVPAIVFYPCIFMVIAAIGAYLSRINQREIRQESYDELLAMLTHQLRRPSSTIAAAVELLESNPKESLTEQQKHTVEIIKQENSRSLALLTNFIESGRVTSKQSKSKSFREVDIAQIARVTAERSAKLAHREPDLKLNLPDQPVNISASPDQISIVFENILNNAFRYSPNKTEVLVSLKEGNDDIEITITDHGQGMTNEQQESQYKRFLEAVKEQSLSAPSKVGLGLYVSRRIIENHKGKLIINSDPGKGTQIIITLKRRSNV